MLQLIDSGHFSNGDSELFRPLVDNLRQYDPYLVLADYADYADYVACQERVGRLFEDEEQWTRMSVLNVARAGKFSSDRAIREYCDEVWNVSPVPIEI